MQEARPGSTHAPPVPMAQRPRGLCRQKAPSLKPTVISLWEYRVFPFLFPLGLLYFSFSFKLFLNRKVGKVGLSPLPCHNINIFGFWTTSAWGRDSRPVWIPSTPLVSEIVHAFLKIQSQWKDRCYFC